MKTVGIFDAKTRLSEICTEVSESGEPVLVTRRGRPLVRITPVLEEPMTVKERRATYMSKHGGHEQDDERDFEAAPRSREVTDFDLEE